MPKNKISYEFTITYKICCLDISISDIYIGHTTNFVKRKCSHKSICCQGMGENANAYVYTFIRDNGGWDNWQMVEIEKYPCQDKNEALKRERYWIETLKASLNKRIPTRSRKEYDYDNVENRKNYRLENINKITAYMKNYYEENIEHIREKTKNTTIKILKLYYYRKVSIGRIIRTL